MLTMPPQRSEVPRTRRRLERMEPNKEYLSTSTLFWVSARIAMINSVAFPHVAFSSPPTEKYPFKININKKISITLFRKGENEI